MLLCAKHLFAAAVSARHGPQSSRGEPLHYLALIEQKISALDQAAPLAGWRLPEEFATLRRLLEARMGKQGKREFVQVLRLMEVFRANEVAAAVRDAIARGAIGFDAVKHLVLFRRLCRIANHEAGVRLWQVKSEEVDLALDATDDADGFTKVCLGMPRRMHQRHEHLLCPLSPAGDIVLHDCNAACEAVFVPKPLEDPLGRMLLLLRSRLVVIENPVDHRNKWIKLRLRRRLLAHVTWRAPRTSSSCSRSADDPEPTGRSPFAQPLNPNCMPHLQIEIHVLHPRPLPNRRQKAICCRIFAPALPEYPAASVRDYCSGAYTLLASNRNHWGIEIMHRNKDVILGEDGYTNRCDNAPRNIFSLTAFVLKILKFVAHSPTRAIEHFQDNKNRAIRLLSGFH